MSEEDRATPEYAQGAAGEQTGTAGHPAGGGLAERGGGPVVPPETAVMAPTPPGGRGRPGDPGGPPRPDPKRAKTVPRPLFYAILSLFLVALLAIAGLVVTRPKATAGVAVRSPSAGVSSPSADNSASASTSPGSSSSGSGAAGSLSPSVSPPTSAAPPATTGTNLFTQNPVQANDATVTNGAAQIGNTAYPDSVRFTCETGVYSATSLVYDVAGFAFLNATLGVPSNAANAAGNTMSITFFKDGSTDQLGKTITTSLDNPVPLHLNLDGTSQLAIDCAATHSATDAPVPMDIAFGNAVLAPS
jgi:hypothetical protein